MAGGKIGAHFADPAAVARYAEGPPRMVPGFEGLHRMMAILLAEGRPAEAHVIVLGAGGGLELRTLARAQPGGGSRVSILRQRCWRWPGGGGADVARMTLVEGVIDDAPSGPFDAATCLLTLHFLEPEERLRTLRALHARLQPGAPLVVAHLSCPREGPGQLD